MLFQEKNPCPHGRCLEITKGKGVFKAKLLKGKYEAKLDFPARWGKGGGGGSNPKNPSMGGGGGESEYIVYFQKISIPTEGSLVEPPPPLPWKFQFAFPLSGHRAYFLPPPPPAR